MSSYIPQYNTAPESIIIGIWLRASFSAGPEPHPHSALHEAQSHFVQKHIQTNRREGSSASARQGCSSVERIDV